MSAQGKHRNSVTVGRGQIIGEPAAEDDDDFLFPTFYEHFAYRTLTDVSSSKFLLLGRTGTGKTAILRRVENQKPDVVRISPQELSLQYISNSDIIKFFYANGVKLDLFFQLLWRHVISTELIKHHFKLDDAKKTDGFFSDLHNLVNAKRRRAIEYMRSFGSDFWLETDARVTQVTQKFESEVTSAAGIDLAPISAELSGKQAFSEEQRKDIVNRAQKVVDNLHLQQLAEVIDWLDEDVFTQNQKPCYVVIDDLDLPFAYGETKYWLIRSLIETCKKFRKVSNVKLIVAIRTDLLERTFEFTRDDGFQEEKYKGNIIELEWSAGELKELVNRRLQESIRRKYGSARVNFDQLFSYKINDEDSFSYLATRTLHRPRDIIAFVNECLGRAVGKDHVPVKSIRQAEETYSADRFNALRDEWRGQYPLLERYCRPIIRSPRRFLVSAITSADVEELVLELATLEGAASDALGTAAVEAAAGSDKLLQEFRWKWLDALYKVGIIGLKTDPGTSVKWNYKSRQSLFSTDVNDDSVIYVHPMLWGRFGTLTRDAEIDPKIA